MRRFQRIAASSICAALAAGAMVCARPATAHERDFPFTYDWFQAARGEKEVEYHLAYDRNEHSSLHELEFEYGVTSRLAIAPYVVFEKLPGQALHYDSVKLETRYQLGTYAPNRILPGLYLEYEKAHDEDPELEAKLILSRYDRAGADLTLNYILERSFSNGASVQHSYSLGYAWSPSRRSSVRAGAEWVHELSSGAIRLGPVLDFRPGRGAWVSAGYHFPVNGRGGTNGGQFRMVAEYEWF